MDPFLDWLRGYTPDLEDLREALEPLSTSAPDFQSEAAPLSGIKSTSPRSRP